MCMQIWLWHLALQIFSCIKKSLHWWDTDCESKEKVFPLFIRDQVLVRAENSCMILFFNNTTLLDSTCTYLIDRFFSEKINYY